MNAQLTDEQTDTQRLLNKRSKVTQQVVKLELGSGHRDNQEPGFLKLKYTLKSPELPKLECWASSVYEY